MHASEVTNVLIRDPRAGSNKPRVSRPGQRETVIPKLASLTTVRHSATNYRSSLTGTCGNRKVDHRRSSRIKLWIEDVPSFDESVSSDSIESNS